MSDVRSLAVFGGVYNNYLALEAVHADAVAAGVDEVICLGDVGAFGPHPDRSVAALREREILTIQGNYDHSVGNGLDDCACGYTDPRDNHYADLSYAYTLSNTSATSRGWLRSLPESTTRTLGGQRLHLCHGSPRRTNEFLWESTTPEPFIERLLRGADTEIIVCTHTGLPWTRWVGTAGVRGVVNVGAIGRPDNDGDTAVHYAILRSKPEGGVDVDVRRVEYDVDRLAAEMRAESIPDEFVQTILTGWWTTCLEILPARERAGSRY